MYCTTVSTAGYINIISIKVTDYTAHITNNCFFCPCISRAHLFCYKTTGIACAGSHNIAAIINAVSNSIIRRTVIITAVAKISRYTADIMRAAHFVFTVSSIGNIGINSTANNTANITGIVKIIAVLFAAAYITGI